MLKRRGQKEEQAAEEGRLLARPDGPLTEQGKAGLHSLSLAEERDALLYVPTSLRGEQPAPLVLMLHGAGADAQQGIALLQTEADAAGFLLLAPASRLSSWDVIRGGYGPDVALIDRALEHTFAHYAADPARLAVGGFSDGASYALSLGLTNGDLFTHALAFSPGFMAPGRRRGRPCVFVSHGEGDAVLPISRTSRKLVPQLRASGYEVLYREFSGGHTAPREVVREAVEWFMSEE